MNERVCSSCQAQMRTDARFCIGCGTAAQDAPEKSALERLCTSCGAGLRDGSRFCLTCGKPVEIAVQQTAIVRSCGSCGDVLRPDARFCLSCGAPAASVPQKRRGQRRTRSRGLTAVPIAAAAVALLIFGAWFFALRGEEAGNLAAVSPGLESTVVVLEQPADIGPNGLPMRRHVRLDHPAGAVADVPAGEVRASDVVDLRQIPLTDDSDTWDWQGSAWQFVSADDQVIAEEVTIQLPAEGTADEAVIARTQMGAWVPLTSEAVTLPSGGLGRAIRVADVPAPWILTVAHPSGSAGIDTSDPSPKSVALDQLYWNDRTEWEHQMEEWLAVRAPLNDQEPRLVSRALPAAAPRNWRDVRDSFEDALILFGAARLHESRIPVKVASDPSIPPAFAVYLQGLDQLAAVRDEWLKQRLLFARDETGQQTREGFSEMPWTADQTLDQAIETALVLYAPWGIDVTRFLIHTNTISSFDLGVLIPYGQEKSADADLSACREDKRFGLSNEPLDSCFLRLYSSRAVERTWVDVLKDWQRVVRWLPVLLPQAGLGTVAVAAADEFIDYWQSLNERDAKAAYLTLEAASAEGSALNFLVDVGLDGLHTGDLSTPVTPGVNLLQTVYGIALVYGLGNTDWYLLQEVQDLTAGSRTYCINGDCASTSYFTGNIFPAKGFDQVPPIIVVAALKDSPPGHPADGYRANRVRLRVWNYDRSGEDLHRFYTNYVDTSVAPCEAFRFCPTGAAWRGGLADLPFGPYKEERWAGVVTRMAPAAQAIRVAVPKAVLAQVAAEYELGPNPSLEEYRLTLRFEAPDGDGAGFALTRYSEPRAGDDPARAYFSVVITGTWMGESPKLEGLSQWPAYLGPEKRMDGRTLRTKLHAILRQEYDSDEDDPRAEATLDFNATPANVVTLYDTIGAERVQLLEVTLGAESGLITYSGLTSQELPMVIVVDPMAQTWKLAQWRWAWPEATCNHPLGSWTRTVWEGDWGVAGNSWEESSSRAPFWLDPATLEQWLTHGHVDGLNLMFDVPPPSVASQLATEDALGTPEGALMYWYGSTMLGRLAANKSSISGTLKLPLSDMEGCLVEEVTFKAERTK